MPDKVLSLTSVMALFYKQTLPAMRGFLNLFFPRVFITTQQQLQIDRYTQQFKNLGYAPLNGSSNLLQFDNGTGVFYAPPLIPVKTPVSEDAFGVTVGVSPNAPVSEHLTQKYRLIQETQAQNIMTTLVLQAIETMRLGAFTAKTLDAQSVGTFTWGRDASLSLASYNTSTSGAYNALKAIFTPLNKFYMPKGDIVALVGSNLMAAIEVDATFKDAMKNNTFQIVTDRQAGEPMNGNTVVTRMCKVKIPGTTHYCTLVTFDEVYNLAGTLTPMFPLNEMIMTSLRTVNTAGYAGIKIADKSKGTLDVFAGEIVTDRLLENEPDDLFIRSQTRGLMIPSNINHIGYLKATDLSAT